MENPNFLQNIIAQKGFITIRDEADRIFSERTPEQCWQSATEFYLSRFTQVRQLAVFLLGRLASQDAQALDFLRDEVSKSTDWKVREILAMAFDRFCRDTGYEAALPVIKSWLGDERANVRRAVAEGLRIWTGRPYFAEHPGEAVALLGALRGDENESVRKSAGNALRDISKKHLDLVRAELSTWDLSSKHVCQTHKLAGRLLPPG